MYPFHIHLQVSVTFANGSYRCLFMSADEFPPPYRIINLSEVPLFFCQANSSGVGSPSQGYKQGKIYSYSLGPPKLKYSL